MFIAREKKSAYEITDGMYRFWYRFVPMAKAAIEMGRGEIYYNKMEDIYK